MRTRLWSNWQRSPRRKQWRSSALAWDVSITGRATPIRQAFSLITVAILQATSLIRCGNIPVCSLSHPTKRKRN
jgi:hypothetical protein